VGAVGAGLLACWEGGGLIAKTHGRIRGLAGGFFANEQPPSPKPLDPDPAVQVGVSIVCTTCLVST
jgi:hypothetical protein